MLFYLQSTNPKEYGTLKLQTNLGLQNEGLAFRVLDFNTIASFVITDETDFIEIEIDGTKSTYHFPKKSTYKLEKLAENITSVISNILTVEFTDMKTLKFSNEKEFKILNMSHRVQLLLGAYHMQLPLESNGNIIKMKFFLISVMEIVYLLNQKYLIFLELAIKILLSLNLSVML